MCRARLRQLTQMRIVAKAGDHLDPGVQALGFANDAHRPMPVVDKHDDGRGAIDAGCLEYSRSAGVAENRFMTVLLGAATTTLRDFTIWGAHLYVWSRLLYVPLYAWGSPFRTLVWFASLIGLVMVIAALFI